MGVVERGGEKSLTFSTVHFFISNAEQMAIIVRNPMALVSHSQYVSVSVVCKTLKDEF